jgi:cob(I)alamin adenosyltransferase
VRYLNRLSDLLFVLARVFARKQSGGELLWQRQRHRPGQDATPGDGS